MRRPLALTALLFILLVRLITWIWPLPVPIPECGDGSRAEYEGEVSGITRYTSPDTGQKVCLLSIRHSKINSSQQNSSQQNSGNEISIMDSNQKNEYQILVYLKEGQLLPEIGSRVRILGKVVWFSAASNPGEFDSREYYQRQGYAFSIKNAELTGKSREYDRLGQLLYRVKSSLGEALDRFLTPREASIVKAMLLGEKKGMDKSVKEIYQMAGISHVLAISGLHISVLGMGTYRILGRLLNAKAAGVISVLFLFLFLCMTGFSPSSMRAGIMFVFGMAARLLGRTYDSPTALAVAAALLLAENPAWIDDSGFQLSFLAAAGAVLVIPRFAAMQDTREWLMQRRLRIGFAGRRYRERTQRSGLDRGKHLGGIQWGKLQGAFWGKQVLEQIRSGFLAGFCISMVTLPVVLSSFYEWNVLSLLINLAVIPLMGILLGGCIVLAAVGCGWMHLEEWILRGDMQAGMMGMGNGAVQLLALPVRAILFVYEKLCTLGGGIRLGETVLPGGMLRTGEPELWQILLFVLGFAALLLAAPRIPRAGGMTAAAILSLVFCLRPGGSVQVTMLDVGQGECIYLETEQGHDYLYDGGSSSRKETGKWQILPFLKQQGVRKLELILVSHWDKDHISGILELMQECGEGKLQIGGLVLSAAGPEDELYRELCGCAQQNGIPIHRMEAGDVIRDGECRFEALYPEGDAAADHATAYKTYAAEGERNNSSLVIRFVREEKGEETFSMLLTGDIEAEGERMMCRKKIEALVLDVPHHGSDSSSSEKFLDAASPRLALISCGRDNSYGHPHAEVLKRLEERGISYRITANSGAVTIRQSGDKITVEPFFSD